MRMTEQQHQDLLARKRQPVAPTPKTRMQALGRLPRGRMNQTEAAYAAHLEARKQAGEVQGYWFEAWKLRLADSTFYSPDFIVLLADGQLQAHEVKGFWTDDARVKIKVAAALHPLAFVAVKKSKSGWDFEWF